MKKITIIGGGNLGTAIANGLLKSGKFIADDITITKRNIQTLKDLKEAGVNVTSDNNKAIKNANVVILAVKPYQVQDIMMNTTFHDGQIVVSAVTGVWLKDLHQWINNKVVLFRAMPNTAIAIQQSMTCISSNGAGAEQIAIVKELFEILGRVTFIEEKLMNAATVLGACGTAFALRYVRATVKGASELLLINHTHPEQEIDKVTTPMGCTIAGLNELEHKGFSSALIKGLVASYEKIS